MDDLTISGSGISVNESYNVNINEKIELTKDLEIIEQPLLQSSFETKQLLSNEIIYKKLLDRVLEDSWQEVLDKAEASDNILLSQDGLSSLFTKFTSNPTWEGVEALLLFKKYLHKTPAGQLLPSYLPSDHYTLLVLTNFAHTWKEAKKDAWSHSHAFGCKMTELLLDVLVGKNKDIQGESYQQFVNNLIVRQLKMTEEKNSGFSRSHSDDVLIAHKLSEKDVLRIRYLLKALRKLKPCQYSDIQSELMKNIKEVDCSLFFDNSQISGAVRYDSNIYKLVLLQEIFVELSYFSECDLGVFLEVKNPVNVTRAPLNNDSFKHKNYFPPSKNYLETTQHTLACTFALCAPSRVKREEMLSSVLTQYTEYQVSKPHYSLQRMILGVINEWDIPIWDKGGPLSDRLQAYKGVFAENISESLKSKFWMVLIHGGFGGKTKTLVDALVAFYLRKDNDNQKGSLAPWKMKAIDALRSLAWQVNVFGTHLSLSFLSFDPVTDYADKVLKDLGF